jgi:hypothetical protein
MRFLVHLSITSQGMRMVVANGTQQSEYNMYTQLSHKANHIVQQKNFAHIQFYYN